MLKPPETQVFINSKITIRETSLKKKKKKKKSVIISPNENLCPIVNHTRELHN